MMEIEKKLRITVFLPQTCFFCGEDITHKGNDRTSLVTHSLDGNHDNWVPENKVFSHKHCHAKYHASNMSEETKRKIGIANIGPEINKKAWPTRRKRYGPSGFKNHGMKRPEVADKFRGDKNPMKNPEIALRAAKTRRDKYGPSGIKDPEAFGKAISDGMKKTNAGMRSWKTRRERYGPTGRKR